MGSRGGGSALGEQASLHADAENIHKDQHADAEFSLGRGGSLHAEAEDSLGAEVPAHADAEFSLGQGGSPAASECTDAFDVGLLQRANERRMKILGLGLDAMGDTPRAGSEEDAEEDVLDALLKADLKAFSVLGDWQREGEGDGDDPIVKVARGEEDIFVSRALLAGEAEGRRDLGGQSRWVMHT